MHSTLVAPAYWLARYWSGFAEPLSAKLAILLDGLNARNGINLHLGI